MAPRMFKMIAVLCFLFAGAFAAEGGLNSIRCSADLAYQCYHDVSKQFVIDRLVPEDLGKKDIFATICDSRRELPLEPKCKIFYSGCFGDDKRRFRIHENGYDFLRRLSIDMETCLAPSFLHICLDSSAIKNCVVERPHAAQSLYNFRKKSHELIEDVRYCVKKATEKCDNVTNAEHLNTVRLALDAASLLNWFDETVEVEPTTPRTTQATTTPTTPLTETTTETRAETTTTTEPTPEPTREQTSESTPQPTTESSTKATATTEHSKEPTEGPHSGASPVNALGAFALVIAAFLRI